MTYTQDQPNAVQIELTEGCNLRCTFCGLNGIRGKANAYKFLNIGVAKTIVKKIRDSNWNPVRIEFAMHGEPSANTHILEIIKEFASLKGSYLMMTSNGMGFVRAPTLIAGVFEAGLHTLAIDEYEGINYGNTIREFYENNEVEFKEAFALTRHEYPADPDGNPHTRSKKKRLVLIKSIDKASGGTHASLNNHCGAGAPKNDKGAGKRCAKPFRELSIRWDGNVAICCNDWRGEYAIGNVKNFETLDALWQSKPFELARRKLYHGERDFGPCAGCDATSYRVGLLPDRMGKQDMSRVTKGEMKAIQNILKNKPLTPPRLRPWEKKGGKK